MKPIVVSLVSGALFGAGLAFSGMADPARVQGFLDLFGNWDPTLSLRYGRGHDSDGDSLDHKRQIARATGSARI